MKFLYSLFLFINIIVHCDAFDKMFMSICKAVIANCLKKDNCISIRPKADIQNTNVSLLIFKGSHIKADSYKGISKTIQKIGAKRGLNIDIRIQHHTYLQDSSTHNKNPSFVLGHSSGVYDFLLFHNVTKYDGLIQIGSVLNSRGTLPWVSRKLDKFPIPVLTLVGRKDGYLRHTYCLDEMYCQNETEKYKTKPIVVMRDITHLHISNTSSTSMATMIGFRDIKSDLNVKIAWDMLGLCIVDFMILNMNMNHLASNSSLKRMKQSYNETQELMSTYYTFNNIGNIRMLLNILHRFLSNMTDHTHEIKFLKYYDFLLSKPSETSMYCHIQDKSYIFSKMYFTPLWIKTKYHVYVSARQINECLFRQIEKHLKIKTRLNIAFKTDKVCSTTIQWIFAQVSIERKGNTIYIQSPVFVTNEKTIVFKRFYYLKILSPAQIVELMNIDLQDIPN